LLPRGHIEYCGELIELRGITYDVPFTSASEDIVINANGEHKLLIKNARMRNCVKSHLIIKGK